MTNKLIYKDLGSIDFESAWKYQNDILQQTIDIKKYNQQLPLCEQTDNFNYLLFCEHPHVYTLGKSGSEQNLLVNDQLLKERGVQFYKIDRGGDITYHGPGQIVGYPILDLEAFSMGVKEYIFNMEEAIIHSLSDFGIHGGRLSGATGVWLDVDDPKKARKICAIGVKVSRYVTMHGFALNVNTDLDFYNYINPCGFVDKGVTSMQKELNRKIELDSIKNSLIKSFHKIFNFQIVSV